MAVRINSEMFGVCYVHIYVMEMNLNSNKMITFKEIITPTK